MIIIRIVGAADGRTPTPHDGQFLVSWNPHTKFGELEVESSYRREDARKFDTASQALEEWRTVSNIQDKRPDGMPNRPLTALTLASEIYERMN